MKLTTLRILFFLFTLIWFSIVLEGQENQGAWTKITDLQQNEIGEVYAITTDSLDLIWIGASTGLYTYDGFRFNKISDLSVISLRFDSRYEHLWIGTNHDLYSLDLQTREMIKMNLQKSIISSVEFFFKDIIEDENHNVWATSFNGLYRCESDTCYNYLIENDTIVIQDNPYTNRLNAVVKHSHPDSLYIASLTGLYTFNLKTKVFSKHNKSVRIVNSLISTDKILYTADYANRVQIQSKSTSSKNFINIQDDHVINKIVSVKNDQLWICTDLGLYSFQDSLRFYPELAEPLYSSKKPSCNTIFTDRFGHHWAGFENGLYLYDPSRNLISAVSSSRVVGDVNAQIFDICEIEKDKILISSNKSNVFEYDLNKERIEKTFDGKDEVLFLSDTILLFIAEQTLMGYNRITNKYFTILNAEKYKEADLDFYLSHLFDKNSNTLFIGRQWGRGISAINIKTGGVQTFNQTNFYAKHQFTPTGFRYLALDQNDHLYFTSGAGLGKLNLRSGSAEVISNPIKSQTTGLSTDSSGNIYAVFARDGLYEVTPNLSPIDIGIKNIETILFDKNNELWATSPQGISNINLESKSFYTLNRENGLPKNNLYGAKIISGISNNIYIYIYDWLARIDKSQLTTFDAYNTKPIITSQGNNRFNFSSRNYKPPGMTSYEYKLAGLHSDWISSNFNNEVEFNNLGPGKYEFQVRSSFGHQPWIISDAIAIKVPYPWWMMWYNIFSIIALISILIWWYVRQVRKQEQLKSQVKILEMETLRSQMNPHFIFNALNSIKHFILANDKFKAAEYLSKFSMLIRKILNNSKTESILLSEELETLKLYINMEQMRFDQKFDYKITIDPNVDTEFVEIPPLILQPYVENAIWHGLLHKESSGYLKINITKAKDHMIYEIEDNGIGRKAAALIKTKSALKRKSLGMQITKDRLRATKTNAKVEVIDLEQGTKVILKIPER